MPFEIAIPTFERYEILNTHTLRVLAEQQTRARITVFVSSDIDLLSYQRAYVDRGLRVAWVVTDTRGLRDKRNAILHAYAPGTQLMQLDDDIEALVALGADRRAGALPPFDAFCAWLFDTARTHGTRLVGVYPLANPYFMNTHTWVGLSYCIGAMFGIIVDHQDNVHNTLQEDKWRTLHYYRKYGCVVRCNWLGIRTRYWKTPGGMQSANQREPEMRTADNIAASVHALHALAPDLLRIVQKKSAGVPDIRFVSHITTRVPRPAELGGDM